MATIHFIQDAIVNESLGVMGLSAYLKQRGHRVDLSLASDHRHVRSLLEAIGRARPDLVAFSVMTPQAGFYQQLAQAVKRHIKVPVIWGGAHPTFMPDVVEQTAGVDIIAMGEAEEPLAELMDRIHDRPTDIPGMRFRVGDHWVRNEMGALVEDLDRYPFPDRLLLYGKSRLLRGFALKRFLTGRGCPFACGFCFEPSLRNLYRGKGRFVRRHSPLYVIEEIMEVLTAYPGGRHVHFSDDTFNLDPRWLSDFLPAYARRVGLPFTCNLAVPLITEETVEMLRDAGCRGVWIGLESGNEERRTLVLNKAVPDDRYEAAAELLGKNRIRLITNNMFALPGETVEDAVQTVRFNRRLRVYAMRTSILKVYRGTQLADYGLASGYCAPEGRFTYRVKTAARDARAFDNLLWMSFFLLRFPVSLRMAVRILRWPGTRFFRWLILFGYLTEVRLFRTPLWQAVWYFSQSPKLFLEGITRRQDE